MSNTLRSMRLLGATALTTLGLASPLAAQAPEPTPAGAPVAVAQNEPDPADITVTARRRDESIVDVPLAITVVTSKSLEKLDITSTEQLANFVPGLQFSDFTPGNSRNDRGGNRPLIFRGLNLSNNGGVTGAGSMFLDGAAVIGNEIPGSMDIGAVEVLRGPQNVYFGRASMTGAVSYRTKAIPDHIEAQVEVTVAERDTHRIEGSLAGPLIPGLLGVRITGLTESNDGYIRNDFNNGASPKLGARSRNSISGTVDLTPAEGLDIKGYVNYFRDEDGISATANIFPQIANCLKGVAVTNLNGSISQPLPTICGEVPGPSNAINYSNTVIPANHAAYLFAIPFLQDEHFKQQVGLQRKAFNSHAVINYAISDYLKFQSITGYHTNAVQQVGDGINQPVQPSAAYAQYYFNLANKFKDFSQELRLSSDPERALSWTAGANYVDAKNLSTAVVTYLNQANGVPTTFTPFPQNIGDDRAKTYGFFGGAYLKLFDNKLTVSAEGRYQIDKRQTITSSATGVFLSGPKADFKSFNPRVSLDYDIGDDRKIYTSYASGSRPGGFNAGLLVYYDPKNPIYTRTTPTPLNYTTVTNSITDTFGVTDPTYKEERLKIGELGLKGRFGGGKGYFDINGYYGILSNQQIRKSLAVPALGFSLGAVTNTGKTEIYGVEFTGNYNVTRQFSVATTFSWNHTVRKTYIDNSPTTLRLYGTGDLSGTELPNTPEFSGSAVLSYEDALTANWNWFANAAGVYRGKQWADIDNLAYIKGRATLDLRAGVSNDTYKIEAFVTNVTNNKTYPGGNVAADFGGNGVKNNFGIASSSQYSGFFGAYAEPRTFGGRFSAKF